MYKFSLGTVALVTDKRYVRFSNPFKLIFHEFSNIKEIFDDNSVCIKKFNFKLIQQIRNCDAGDVIDLIGVVCVIGEMETFVCSNGALMSKRDLMLMDLSSACVTCTVFDAEAENVSVYIDSFPIVSIKGARVSSFCGRSVQCGFSSIIEYNLPIVETELLLGLRQELSGGACTPAINITKKGLLITMYSAMCFNKTYVYLQKETVAMVLLHTFVTEFSLANCTKYMMANCKELAIAPLSTL